MGHNHVHDVLHGPRMQLIRDLNAQAAQDGLCFPVDAAVHLLGEALQNAAVKEAAQPLTATVRIRYQLADEDWHHCPEPSQRYQFRDERPF